VKAKFQPIQVSAHTGAVSSETHTHTHTNTHYKL